MSTLFSNLAQGGPTVYILLVLAFIALFIIIERGFHLHRAQIDVREFLRGIINVLRRKNVLEAISICDDTPGPVAHVIRAALTRCDRKAEDRRRAVEETCLSEVPRLERHLRPLLTITHLAPLLGLLGTLIGMVTLFAKMEQANYFLAPKETGASLWPALLSSAIGLSVAITTYGFYQYFVSKIERILLDMEKAASEILHFLDDHELTLENADAKVTHQNAKEAEASDTTGKKPADPKLIAATDGNHNK